MRLYRWIMLNLLKAELACITSERKTYSVLAESGARGFTLGPRYQANMAEQERDLRSRIAFLESWL